MEKTKKIKIFIGLSYLILISIFLFLFFSKFSLQEITSYNFIKENRSYFIELKNHNLFEFEEGCLSIPGFNETISRPDKIELKWQDISGKEHIDEPEGLLTVCIQHEIDHLNGKLFVDYLSPLKRQLIRKKMKKNKAN